MSSLSFRILGISQRTLHSTLQRNLCSKATGRHTTAEPGNSTSPTTATPGQGTGPTAAAPCSDSLLQAVQSEMTVDKLMDNAAVRDMPVDMINPYSRDRIQCILCRYNVELDYKNAKLLSQFISSFTGNVYEKHKTRLCQKQHDRLVEVIKKSRRAGYLPKLFKKVEFLKDPKLFDPNNPIKSNPF